MPIVEYVKRRYNSSSDDAYSRAETHSSSLKPTKMRSGNTNTGRLTSLPSEANKASNCSSESVLTRSFKFNSLYRSPLVLKNLRIGRLLALSHDPISAVVGFCVMMSRISYVIPCASSHLRALMQVPHLAY